LGFCDVESTNFFRRLCHSFFPFFGILFLYAPRLCLEKKERAVQMTLIVDDAGSGDLLFGVVIGIYREETGEFKYDLVNVRFYQELFCEKEYLKEASRITSRLVDKLKVKPDEEIHVCQGNIFDVAVADLQKVHGEERVRRIRVTGEAQRLVEIAYLDEVRNLGYEPLAEREEKRAKSFFHMMRWLKTHPDMLRYAKTGWPRLKRYRLFRAAEREEVYEAVCSECGSLCEVPFKPEPNRPVFCQACWKKHKPRVRMSRKGKVAR
jgi:CxxC-x17-CxxC domain-containing protein